MKKLAALAGVVFVFSVHPFGFCDTFNPSISGKELLAKLEVKQSKKVNSYEAYMVTALVVGRSPLITVTYMAVDKKADTSNAKQLLFIGTDATSAEKQAVLDQIQAMQTFKPASVVAVKGKTYFEDGKDDSGLVRLNYYDAQHRMRMAEWRQMDSGFAVMTVLYSETGRPLTLTLFSHLKINGHFEHRNISGNGEFESYRHFSREADGLQLNDVVGLQKFIGRIVRERFQNIGEDR